MNWDDVRVFLAVARAGHILGAARRLGMNHATVARRLDRLEDALKAKLFVRRPSGSNLTDDGERLLAHAERMEAEMLGGLSDIGDPDVAIEGTVRIGAPEGFGSMFLAPRIGLLKSQHPGLLLQIVPVHASFSLSRRDADIAIAIEHPTAGRLITRKLTDYALGLFASRDYLERFGIPATPGDLADHIRIGSVGDLPYSLNFGHRNDVAEQLVSGWKADVEISSTLGRMEAIRAGVGIGVVQCYLARRHENLVQVLSEFVFTTSYWLVYHEELRDTRRISIVTTFIANEVRKAALNDAGFSGHSGA